jgi:hypothetical protein
MVKLHSQKLTTPTIRNLILRGYRPVYSSKQMNLGLVFTRIKALMDSLTQLDRHRIKVQNYNVDSLEEEE